MNPLSAGVSARPDLDDADAGRFLGMCGSDNFFLERFAGAERAGHLAVATGESTANPLATGYGLMTLGAVRYTQGHLAEALELSVRVLTLFQEGIGGENSSPPTHRGTALTPPRLRTRYHLLDRSPIYAEVR